MTGRSRMIVRYQIAAGLLAVLLVAPGSDAAGPEAAASAEAAAPAPAGDAGSVAAGENLTLERCIAIAKENHPSIAAARYGLRASNNRVGQARSGYYPQITLSSGYSRYSLITDPTDAEHDLYSANATLTQSLFEFGRTWNAVTIEQRNRDAAEGDLRYAENQVVYGVKSAYYDVLQAQRSVEVLMESVKSFERHLEQARAFFETGVRSKFDVTKAEVDLSNARLALIRGQNLHRISRAQLNNAMGVPDAPEHSIQDDLPFVASAVTLEEAVQRAYQNRPDLQAAQARTEAADASLSYARKGFLPTITGSASYTKEAEDLPLREDGWSAGVTLTFPLFSGFLTSYQAGEAKANLNVAKANEEGRRHAVLLDVQRAYLNLREAEERVGVAELTVRQAEESYAIAQGRYEAGVGSIIEETDALVALRNAKLGHISALADFKVQEAALKKAMGEN